MSRWACRTILLEMAGLRLCTQVYISYALMEASKLAAAGEEEEGAEAQVADDGNAALARAVFERGYKDLKARGEKEDVSGPSEVELYRP